MRPRPDILIAPLAASALLLPSTAPPAAASEFCSGIVDAPTTMAVGMPGQATVDVRGSDVLSRDVLLSDVDPSASAAGSM